MKRTPFAFIALFLVLSAWVLTHLEIGGWDEGLYTRRAYIFEFLTGDWAPVYSFYLALFKPFAPDALWVFYLSRGFLLFILLPLSLFQLARLLTKDSDFAFLSALTIPLMAAVFQLDPGVHVFNACVVALVLVALSERRRGFIDFAAFLVLGSLPFIRQENALYLLALLGFGLGVNPKRGWGVPVAGLLFALLYWRLGSPYLEKRSLYAFCDHWYWNHGSPAMGPNQGDRVQFVLEKFGRPAHLRELILDHAGEVLPYFAANFAGLLRQLFNGVWEGGLLPLGILLLVGRRIAGRSIERPRAIWVFITLVVFAKAVILSSMLSPKPEYFIDLYMLGAMISLRVFTRAVHPWMSGMKVRVLLLAVVWFPLYRWMPEAPRRDSLLAVRGVLQRELAPPLGASPFLGTETQIVYLGPHPRSLSVFGLHPQKFAAQGGGSYSLTEFVNDYGLAAVVLGPEFRRVARELGLLGMVEDFERSPGPFRVLAAGDAMIYIRNERASMK